MSKINRNYKTVAEFENAIDIYESNGFYLKSRTETEAHLSKTTRKKYKWNFLTFWIAVCSCFIIPIAYNLLHIKTEKVHITLNKGY